MTVLGLTGPTGAGKSTVARLLKKAGAFVIDADCLAREITEKGHPCLVQLAERFGADILHADGSLDRAALAKKAFANAAERQALNAITHPLIIARTKELLAQCDTKTAVIDAALLFESGMDALCDKTVAVIAPVSVRKARIMARDGLTSERADERIAAQHNDDFYRERATVTMENDSDPARLTAAVTALIGEVT